MSYTLDFVLSRVSSDNKEAFQELENLQERYCDDEKERNIVLVALHDALIQRYPCLCSYADDDPAIDESPWVDGPLMENFRSEMGMVAISYSRVDEVVPFVIQTAIDLKITVFDGQTGEIFRPGETRVSPEPPLKRVASDNKIFNVLKSLWRRK
jgi:hypothetical protein